MRVIASSSCIETAAAIGKTLNVELIKPNYTFFPDGEISVDISPKDINNHDCLLVHSLAKSINKSILMLLLEINALQHCGAKKITVFLPYLAYARQTHTQPLIAALMQTAGAHACITIDPHTYDKSASIPIKALYPTQLFADHIKATQQLDNLIIVAPDQGAIERCKYLHSTLGLTSDPVHIDKIRINGSCTPHTLHGAVKGKNCILVDDIIDTGETLCGAATILIQHGAADVMAYCTHGVLSEGALERVHESAIKRLVITNTINQQLDTKTDSKIEIICADHLLSAHSHKALLSLF